MKIEVLDRLEKNMTSHDLLDGLGIMAVSLVQKNIRKGPWKQNSAMTQDVKQNNKPLQDKGGLVSSISHEVQSDHVVIGSNHIAANILHNGGEIKPKNSRFLAIPASRETRRFMRKYGATPRSCIQSMKSAGYNIWFQKNVILAKAKYGTRTYLLFVLKRSIRIPARPYLKLPDQSIEILKRKAVREIMK